jgi:membrane-associated phospholipid phosphatase
MSYKNKKNLISISLLFAIIIGLYISINAAGGHSIWFDKPIARLFSHVSPSLHPFFINVSEMGDKKGIVVVALILLLWLLIKRRNFTGAGVFALSLALGYGLNNILKDAVARPRPSLEHFAPAEGYSFPSGHSMLGMIVYIFIAYLLIEVLQARAAKIIVTVVTIMLLLLIGASRIILQVHYPSDVLGGFALGYIWVVISIFIYKYVQRSVKKG